MFSLRPLASGSRIAARSLVKPPPRVARTFTSSLSLRSNTHERDQGATGPGQRAAPSGPSGKVPDAELSDPYPLPFSPDVVDLNNADSGPETARHAGVNLASDSQGVDGVTAPMRVPGREGEDRNTKVARLVYQCRKRGTLETDLLLSTFAKKELRQLPDKELDELDMVSCAFRKIFHHGR